MAITGLMEKKRTTPAKKRALKTNKNGKDATSGALNRKEATGRISATLSEAPRRYTSYKNFTDTYELPGYYEKTNLTLISRDPNWIHAYWEISHSSLNILKEKLQSDFERISYTLRLYDVTCVHFNGQNANNSFDINFDPNHTNSWYINLWCDNAAYCGELGARLPDGNFIPIARSNTVITPKKNPSHRLDEIWMSVDDESSNAPFAIVEYKENGKRQGFAHSGGPKRRKIYLTDDDIREYYSRLSPLLRKILARRLKEFDLYKDKKGYFDEIIMRGSKKRFIKRLLLGASEELILEGGASEYLGSSEGASVREALKRKFFFEIGTELIVYGRTEPDAQVSLGKKNIPLKKDGTFSLRFALPDGNIPLDFTARSKNGIDKRRIETSVLRSKTKYED